MPQPIQLYRTTGTTAPTAPLLVGELAVAVAPSLTRMWLGDGTVNRLLMTSDPQDPLGPAVATGNFLPLTGGQMTGAIELLPPLAGPDATNKTYVDSLIASLQLFSGTWQVAANIPNLIIAVPTAGDFYIAVTAVPTVPEIAPAGVPGIGGQSINNGDMVIWNEATTQFELVRGGPLTVAEANALYLQLTGGAMTGPLVLAADPTVAMQAATRNYVDTQMVQFLPLAGGLMTGTITMPMGYAPVLDEDVATRAWVLANAVSAVVTDGVSILGTGVTGSPLAVGLVDGGIF